MRQATLVWARLLRKWYYLLLLAALGLAFADHNGPEVPTTGISTVAVQQDYRATGLVEGQAYATFINAAACSGSPTAANALPDHEGRLWTIQDWQLYEPCAFKNDQGQPLFYDGYSPGNWLQTPTCPVAAISDSPLSTEVVTAVDSEGKIWGFIGAEGTRCAFKGDNHQPIPTDKNAYEQLSWTEAPACRNPASPDAATAAPDKQGCLWGWQNNRICAYKNASTLQPKYYKGYMLTCNATLTTDSNKTSKPMCSCLKCFGPVFLACVFIYLTYRHAGCFGPLNTAITTGTAHTCLQRSISEEVSSGVTAAGTPCLSQEQAPSTCKVGRAPPDLMKHIHNAGAVAVVNAFGTEVAQQQFKGIGDMQQQPSALLAAGSQCQTGQAPVKTPCRTPLCAAAEPDHGSSSSSVTEAPGSALMVPTGGVNTVSPLVRQGKAINPVTKRIITINKGTYKDMVSQGYLLNEATGVMEKPTSLSAVTLLVAPSSTQT